MEPMNPYASPLDIADTHTPKPRMGVLSHLLIGFCIGASIPGCLGVYTHHQFNAYVESLPPGEFVCGNPGIVPMALIVFVAPFLGFVGAIGGAIHWLARVNSGFVDTMQEPKDFPYASLSVSEE